MRKDLAGPMVQPATLAVLGGGPERVANLAAPPVPGRRRRRGDSASGHLLTVS